MDEDAIVHGQDAPLFRKRQIESVEDVRRLKTVKQRVLALMLDGRPRTLKEIADVAGCSETSASARIRELGGEGHPYDKKQLRRGLWYYWFLIDRGPA